MTAELRKHERTVNFVMTIAMVTMLGRLVLLSVDEIVPFGAELGEFLYDLSLAYAAAWFFQWLVIVRA